MTSVERAFLANKIKINHFESDNIARMAEARRSHEAEPPKARADRQMILLRVSISFTRSFFREQG